MKTGLVVELHGGNAVVLRPDGAFVERRALPGWVVGGVVPLAGAPQPKTIVLRRLAAVAACLLLLLAAGVAGYTLLYETTSVISIDINPSIELGLNRRGRVVLLTAYNADGDALLAGLDLKGLPYDQAIPALLQSEGMQRYLAGPAVLEFSVYSQGSEQLLLDYLTSQGGAVITHHPQLRVYCSGVGQEMVELAHRHGTTAGKMRALLELEALEPGLNIDDYTHHSMGEIRRMIDEHHGGGAGQGHGGGHGGGDGDGADNGNGEAGSGSAPGTGHGSSEPDNEPNTGHGGGHDDGHGGHGHGTSSHTKPAPTWVPALFCLP